MSNEGVSFPSAKLPLLLTPLTYIPVGNCSCIALRQPIPGLMLPPKAAAQAMKGVRSSTARQVARNAVKRVQAMKGVRSSTARQVAHSILKNRAVKRVGGCTCNGFTPLLIALRAIRAIVLACTRLILVGRTTPLVPFTHALRPRSLAFCAVRNPLSLWPELRLKS